MKTSNSLKQASTTKGFPGAELPSSQELKSIPALHRAMSKTMQTALHLHMEDLFGNRIRRVVAFEELTKVGGGCNTCIFTYTEVDVYFKNWSGRLLKYSLNDDFSTLVLTLSQKLGGTIA